MDSKLLTFNFENFLKAFGLNEIISRWWKKLLFFFLNPYGASHLVKYSTLLFLSDIILTTFSPPETLLFLCGTTMSNWLFFLWNLINFSIFFGSKIASSACISIIKFASILFANSAILSVPFLCFFFWNKRICVITNYILYFMAISADNYLVYWPCYFGSKNCV